MNTTPDLYCVMGNPIAHSRSPWIHARFAALTDEPLHYERRLVAIDGFAQALRDFAAAGGRGCNITVPFKLQAAEAFQLWRGQRPPSAQVLQELRAVIATGA